MSSVREKEQNVNELDAEVEAFLSEGLSVETAEAQDSTPENAVSMEELIEALHHARQSSRLYNGSERELLQKFEPAIRLVLKGDGQKRIKLLKALNSDGWDSHQASDVITKCLEAEDKNESSLIFPPLSLEQLLTMPSKRWIINNLLGKSDLAMLYSPPGSGKTFVVIDMTFAACLAQPFAGRFEVERPLNVAYAAGEGVSGLPARFAAAAEHYGVTKLPNFTFYPMVPELYREDDTVGERYIWAFVQEWQKRQAKGEAQPLDILFIDTMHSAIAGADENSAKDMGKVLQAAKTAAMALDCAVVLIHHTNKNGSAERGSSALRGAMDCMIEIKAIGESGTKAMMQCAKLKDGAAWTPQTFDLITYKDSVYVHWDAPTGDGNPAKGKEDAHLQVMLRFMRSQPGTRLTAKILAEVAGIGQNNAGRILSRAVEGKLCTSELMDTSKKNSNRNPLVYYVDLS